MTFLDLAKKVLLEENKALSPDEIWKLAEKKGYIKDLNSIGKTPWSTLYAVLLVEVRDNKNSEFVQIDIRPKRYILKSQKNISTEKFAKENLPLNSKIKSKFSERDLHPLLAYYSSYFLKCYSKTINHSVSNKKEFGEWVHPDMVGCYFPLEEWRSEVVELSSSIGNISIKIFSFEIKKILNFSNLRESFFQAVSNSSWANESYLVVHEISDDPDFMTELSRLSSSFGIGLIKLDVQDPNSSRIILPAKFRENLDWETINKLASMNNDFKEFIKRIKNDISSNEIRKEKYDKIFKSEELIKLYNKE